MLNRKSFAVLAVWLVAGSLFAGEASKTTTPVSKPSSEWQQKHKAFLAAAKKGGIELLFLGDSITEYWNTTGKDVWAKNYAPLQAANFGIAADRTEHVLWRITNGELDGIAPKVVVLLIGINNTWGGGKGKDIADGISAIVKTVREKLPQSKVLLLAIFPTQDPSPAVKQANDLAAKLDDGKHVRFLDIAAKLAPNGVVSKDVFPDGLHPSAKGYELWVEGMQPLLKEMLGK